MNNSDFNDDESYAALCRIAAKLKEVDELFIGAWEKFPKHVREKLVKIDPKEEMSPLHWSQQFSLVAEAVADEAREKRLYEQDNNVNARHGLDLDDGYLQYSSGSDLNL